MSRQEKCAEEIREILEKYDCVLIGDYDTPAGVCKIANVHTKEKFEDHAEVNNFREEISNIKFKYYII